MEALTERIVRRLREDPSAMSRNRYFRTFAAPAARRARRIAFHLRDLEATVLREPSRVVAGDKQVLVHVDYPGLRATRTAYLTRREFELLMEDPQVAARLA